MSHLLVISTHTLNLSHYTRITSTHTLNLSHYTRITSTHALNFSQHKFQIHTYKNSLTGSHLYSITYMWLTQTIYAEWLREFTIFLRIEKERFSKQENWVLTKIVCVAEEGRIVTNLLKMDLHVVVIEGSIWDFDSYKICPYGAESNLFITYLISKKVYLLFKITA
jgi:hypothetical protein